MVTNIISAITQQTINEQQQLLDLIDELIAALARFSEDIEWGSSVWAQDQEFLDFVQVQRISLKSSRETAMNGLYREAYNTIRIVLEGYLLLRLIFTCDKYPTWYRIGRAKGDKSLDDAKAKFKEHAQRDVPDLVRIENDGERIMVLIRRGIRVVDDQGNDTGVVVPYYSYAWHQYRPNVHHLAKPGVQRELLPEWTILKSTRAKLTDMRHRDFYLKLFTFDSMLRNLRWNGVLNQKTAARVTVHYNFLSGFTHSTKDAIRLSQPWNSFPTRGDDIAYNHYKSELALLYVCHLLAMHLELAIYYFQRWRPLHVKNIRKTYRSLCRQVNQDFGFFWFIFNAPHYFDKYQQANRKSDSQKGIVYRPEHIRNGDVRYYDDPLNRLRQLHLSQREFSTGNVFDSPFLRADALYYL